ncbi:MAG: hypothetical protein LBI95_03275 [Holosporales bacterium]|jgi:hypothetical protein|nr:hypothetical protein [Holosporales bacterium]
MVYGLFRLGRRIHVMFEAGRLVQALIGNGEEKEIHESLEHGLRSIIAF